MENRSDETLLCIQDFGLPVFTTSSEIRRVARWIKVNEQTMVTLVDEFEGQRRPLNDDEFVMVKEFLSITEYFERLAKVAREKVSVFEGG